MTTSKWAAPINQLWVLLLCN